MLPRTLQAHMVEAVRGVNEQRYDTQRRVVQLDNKEVIEPSYEL
jgi:hypothetical protein